MTPFSAPTQFITDFYLLVLDWARWAASIVETWPGDPRQATHDPQVIAETVDRARRAATDGNHTPARPGT